MALCWTGQEVGMWGVLPGHWAERTQQEPCEKVGLWVPWVGLYVCVHAHMPSDKHDLWL